MQYDYKAINPEGRRIFGRLDAINLTDLEMRLKRQDLDLVSGQAASQRKPLGRGRTPRRELINFCFHLEQMTRSGVPLLQGLADLRDSLEHPRFRQIVAHLIETIEGGQSLSQAMSAFPRSFDPVFVNLIRAGETSGQLPEVLAELESSLKWQDELAAHTRKLLIYPSFVGTIVVAASIFLMVYMVPQLKLFVRNMGQSLPPQTRALFFLSDLLANYWLSAIALLLLAALAVHIVLGQNPLARLRLDGTKLRLPVVGAILKKICLARCTSTFAMLYAAGIPVLEAIRSTQDIAGNRVIRQALQEVEQSVRAGRNLAAAFQDAAIFPPLVVRMVKIGESTGGLDQALLNVTYFYNRDIRESIAKAQTLIEPVLTLCLGAVLGWIMLAALGPVYEVISRIRT